MTDEIEISDDVLRAALDAWRWTPWHLGWGREALRNACKVAIKADRESDARCVASFDGFTMPEIIEIGNAVRPHLSSKTTGQFAVVGAVAAAVTRIIRARNGGNHDKAE